MPSYKKHSIHGEIILPKIEKMVSIDREDMKTFSQGPDSLLLTDYEMFHSQHSSKTKDYFETLLKLVKDNKMQDDGKIMAFLYGQLDHFILDVTFHPLIYYMTENLPKNSLIKPHGLVEMWIDDYIMKKHNISDVFYYHQLSLNSKKLCYLINNVYKKVYDKDLISLKYSIGIKSVNLFDLIARRGILKYLPFIASIINLGNIAYDENIYRVLPYLNLNHNVWYNPETGEEYRESFDDLWNKSIDVIMETIYDVNSYLYRDKNIKNPIILNNTSYDTGIPCEKGQSLKYVKKYVNK